MEKQYKIWRTETALWEKLKPIAREMRQKPTEAEKILWGYLRNHNLMGFKFRHQHNIERFIVDFYCAQGRLIIEVDGPIHQYQKEEDLIRQQFLESRRYKVIRFTNDEVLYNPEGVVREIKKYLPTSPPLIPPLRARRGG
jgi:very-short-patch-repair endonuclease